LPQGILSQPIDTLFADPVLVSRFAEARAMGVDQYGLLYVVDAGDATIRQLDPTGEVLATMGGPGKGDYEFDDPSDIDPSNGVVFLIADAGNNRVKRFSREFLHLESIPLDVSSLNPSAGRGGFRENDGSPLEYVQGRPIAVAGTMSGEIYAIDEEEGVVVKWNPSRDVSRVFGSYGDGAGALVEPVALALDVEGNVYVGDRGHGAILVFDRFGAYIRRLADGHAATVAGLAAFRDGLLVVLADRILVYDLNGLLRRTLALKVDGAYVDAAVRKDALYVLLSDRLYMVYP
jgi:hypothetical protein